MNKQVVSFVKQLKDNDMGFNVDFVCQHFSKLNPKEVTKDLKDLVKQHKLSMKYEVINPNDSSEFLIYKSKKNIPFGGEAYYKNTGDDFYVSKYNPNIELIFNSSASTVD